MWLNWAIQKFLRAGTTLVESKLTYMAFSRWKVTRNRVPGVKVSRMVQAWSMDNIGGDLSNG